MVCGVCMCMCIYMYGCRKVGGAASVHADIQWRTSLSEPKSSYCVAAAILLKRCTPERWPWTAAAWRAPASALCVAVRMAVMSAIVRSVGPFTRR